jgi:peptidoglycan/xylan/chitin deacetylase (PgdA/CDA1 family)
VASAIWRAAELPFAGRLLARRRAPLVIGYHRIVESFTGAARTDMPTLLTSRAMFERHVEAIGRHYTFASLDEIGERIRRGEPFRKPVAAITFDDGYRDVYENAFPMLKRKGIPAAVFVVTEVVGRSGWQIHDKLYHLMAKAYRTWNDPWLGLSRVLSDVAISPDVLPRMRSGMSNAYHTVSLLLPAMSQAEADRVIDYLDVHIGNGHGEVPPTLTWPMLAEMRRAGMTIGSHTRTHAWLARESAARRAEELQGSKDTLERQLREPIHHLAYPGGQFTREVVDDVARAGYRYAYTACPHGDSSRPELTIERLLLWEGSSIDHHGDFSTAILNCQIHDFWPPARRCSRVHRDAGDDRAEAVEYRGEPNRA